MSTAQKYAALVRAIEEFPNCARALRFAQPSATLVHEVAITLSDLAAEACALELDLREEALTLDHDGDTQPNNERPEQPTEEP